MHSDPRDYKETTNVVLVGQERESNDQDPWSRCTRSELRRASSEYYRGRDFRQRCVRRVDRQGL
jgi:hypothetical protein